VDRRKSNRKIIRFIVERQAAPKIAREAVALLGKLFAVEKWGKDMDISVAERREPRQEQSVPVLAEREAQVLSRTRSGDSQSGGSCGLS
jgi:hypothetical protein